MIFITLNQLNCFLLFLFFGIILGFVYQIFSVIFLKNFQKIYLKSIFNGIFCAFFGIFYVFFINFYNFGKYPPALLFAFLLGIFWVKKLCAKSVVFLQNKWYNLFKRLTKNEKSTHKN